MLVNNNLPKGTIVMWYGSINDIPDGWTTCDGNNGTPNLKKKFIVGADDSNEEYKFLEENEAKTKNRGSDNVYLTIEQMPRHNHKLSYSSSATDNDQGWPDAGFKSVYATDRTGASGNTPVELVGDSDPHENRPPYFALYFIMKVI